MHLDKHHWCSWKWAPTADPGINQRLTTGLDCLLPIRCLLFFQRSRNDNECTALKPRVIFFANSYNFLLFFCKSLNKLRGARLRWYGHVKRRDEGYVGRKTLEMAVPGRRKNGSPKRWLDVVREDMVKVEAVEGQTNDTLWRPRIGSNRKKKTSSN